MKVALVHDYIKEYGGAERVLEALHEIWPKAPVFTTVYIPKYLGPHKKRFKDWDIRPSFLQYIPFKGKLISLFRFIGPWIFKSFDLSGFDVVIVSAAGTFVSPNIINKKKGSVHICYCHTPPRWLYGYSTAASWDKIGWRKALKFFGQIPMHFLRLTDFKAGQIPDYFIANSKEVASRIEKFYRRDSTVIYPPVDIENDTDMKKITVKRDYYLAGGRLARPKRVDIAVKACTKLKLPLVVFGKTFAGCGEELIKMAGPVVEFVGEVTDRARRQLMAEAKAFIFPSDMEDFGITPVEAMAQGTPVIAYRSGGVVESVVESKTGVFFDEPTPESLIGAISKFESMKMKSEDCTARAKKFSKERFKKEMLQFVNKHAGTS